MIKSSKKKTQAPVPSMDIPAGTPPVENPGKEGSHEDKLAYLIYKGSKILPEFPQNFGVQEERPRALEAFNLEARELANDLDEYYMFAQKVNDVYHNLLRIKFKEIPGVVFRKFLPENYSSSSRYPYAGDLTTREMESFIRLGFGAHLPDQMTVDYVLDLEITPNQYNLLNFDGATIERLLREERAFAGLRNLIYRQANYQTNNSDYQTFRHILESPACIQPRTLEVMHSMLLQAMTGVRGASHTSEAVPDTVLRRHFIDQTYRITHYDIVNIWRVFLITCQDHQKVVGPVFNGLSFTEFVCTGQVTARMVREIHDMLEYAVRRVAEYLAMKKLRDRAGLSDRYRWENASDQRFSL